MGRGQEACGAQQPSRLRAFHPPAGAQLIYATDLQTRLAVSRLRVILTATWGLLGGEGAFIPLAALYLYL